MKRILYFAAFAALMACTPKEYTINGYAGEDYEGKTVYLRKLDGTVLDSCVVADKHFAIKGQMDTQIVCNLTSGWMKTPVLIKNGAEIDVDFTSIPAMARDNGGMNDKLYAIIKQLTDARMALMNKEDKVKAIRFLNDSGAFLITKSGQRVCNFFGISKYTLYSYIDEAKGDKE